MAGTASNDYYTRGTDFPKLTRAKGPAVQGEFDNVQTGFDAVGTAASALTSAIAALEAGTFSTTWPTALNKQFTLTSVSGTDTITATAPNSPDSSDTIPDGTHFFLVPVADNTGAATLDIGTSEGAEPIQKDVSGTATDLSAGDLRENVPMLIVYDSANGKWMLYVPNVTSTPTVLHKSGDYVITAGNVNAPICVVAVDASGGSVDIDLPTVANLNGKLVYVFLDTDPGTNDVEVDQSDSSTQVWVGVEKGDFVWVTSDGSSYKVLDHHEGHYARVYVSADEGIAQGASEQITTIAETTDTGGIWNTSNDEVDVPFDCWIDLYLCLLSTAGSGILAEAKLNSTYLRDSAAVSGTIGTAGRVGDSVLAGRFSADAGQKLELWAHNIDTDDGSENVLGDAAGDESFATIKLTRRY